MISKLAGIARVLLNPKGLPLGAAIVDTTKTAVNAVRNKDSRNVG